VRKPNERTCVKNLEVVYPSKGKGRRNSKLGTDGRHLSNFWSPQLLETRSDEIRTKKEKEIGD